MCIRDRRFSTPARPFFRPLLSQHASSITRRPAGRQGRTAPLLRALTLQMARLAHPLVLKAFVCARG
eukprot:2043540-Alexandrium_andersonii.AAC.1